MKRAAAVGIGIALLVPPCSALLPCYSYAQAAKQSPLSEEEEDRLREAQEPSPRIEAYLDLAQARLDRFENFRGKPADPRYDNGAYLDKLLGEYVSLDDELKNWIEDQYDRRGDMRRGLHTLLERLPRQLDQLRRIEQTRDALTPDYSASLRDAIDDATDTLDGAAKALAGQEKLFGELKRQEKADARAAKERAKEEQKRNKEEKKLRKQEQKKNPDPDRD